MEGYEVVKVVIDKRRLMDAIEDHGGENCCDDQAWDREYFAKERLLSDSNALRHVPSGLSLVVLPGMHVFLKPCRRLVAIAFDRSAYDFSTVIRHSDG